MRAGVVGRLTKADVRKRVTSVAAAGSGQKRTSAAVVRSVRDARGSWPRRSTTNRTPRQLARMCQPLAHGMAKVASPTPSTKLRRLRPGRGRRLTMCPSGTHSRTEPLLGRRRDFMPEVLATRPCRESRKTPERALRGTQPLHTAAAYSRSTSRSSSSFRISTAHTRCSERGCEVVRPRPIKR